MNIEIKFKVRNNCGCKKKNFFFFLKLIIFLFRKFHFLFRKFFIFIFFKLFVFIYYLEYENFNR